MIIENFLERVITQWIPFVFGYIIIPFRYVYHFIIDRPFTFGVISLTFLFFSLGFMLSDKFFDRADKHISIFYIDFSILILSAIIGGLVVVGLTIKY